MRPIIYPYKLGSASAKGLSNSLRNVRGKRVRERGNYHYFRNHLIINWGNPRLPNWRTIRGAVIRWVNKPSAVAVAGNKLKTYELLKDTGVLIPEFTTSANQATIWLNEKGIQVLARTVLNGHSGIGIKIMPSDPPNFFNAPLYVKYFKKRDEYRVHVFNGKIIDIQQKKKRRETEVDYQVRNYDKGWVFCRENINCPQLIKDQAVLAVQKMGLDFGAVDIGWNEKKQTCCVFEVNTAPGIEGTTLRNYVNAIREII
jgi:glutathione synthase/RimK-type ligase-like ATP-grasp enzyme